MAYVRLTSSMLLAEHDRRNQSTGRKPGDKSAGWRLAARRTWRGMSAGSRHAAQIAIAVALLAPAAWLAPAAAMQVEPRVEVLDNGLKLLLVERHEQPTVAACVVYDVGSVNDPRGQSGIAHLFEHMLFKGSTIIGTSDYQAEKPLIEQQEKLRVQMNDEMDRMRLMKRRGEIADVLDPAQWTQEYSALKKQFDELAEKQRQYIKNNELFNLYTTNGGAGLNAGTSEDFTIYFVQLPSNKIELFFWLESDRMNNGIMREFYIERDNVREERRLRTESTPTGKLDEAFEAMFWQAHPYGVPVLGWASEVESITAQDVRDFYAIYYAPNNARMVLVGDFDSNKVVEQANRYFGRIPRGKEIPRPIITEEPAPLAERRFDAEAETNPRVEMRFHTVAMGHPDEPALDVLSQLLSGKSGRLYKRLVTKEEATMQPFAFNGGRKYAGHFTISATVKEGHEPEQVETMMLEEIGKLKEGEITEYELQKVKNQVLADSVQRLRNNTGLMFQLAISDTWYKWQYLNEAPELMLKVTPDDIHRVVKKYFDPKTRTVAIYRTKAGAAVSETDKELTAALEGIPEEGREQIKAALKRITESTDLQKLQDNIKRLEEVMDSGQAPDDQKPALNIMLKAMKARAAELQAGGDTEEPEGEKKESD